MWLEVYPSRMLSPHLAACISFAVGWKAGGLNLFLLVRFFFRAQAFPDKKAETVLGAYQRAVERFGRPRRVRFDKGAEGRLIALHQIWYWYSQGRKPLDSGSFITGRSINNTRIERMWRDFTEGPGKELIELFEKWEKEGIYIPYNDFYTFVLHAVMMKRVRGSWSYFCRIY